MKTKEAKIEISVGTWLPVFSGFYGTLLGDKLDLANEIEYINDERTSKNLSLIDYDYLKIDYSEANDDLSKSIFNKISIELKQRGLITSAVFDGLRSPREYNFANDSINCTFNFSKENIEIIEKYITKNFKEWDTLLKNKFTSYSGFISFHGNYASHEDWINIKEVLTHDYRCGALLEFILLNEEYDEMSVYDEVEFYMSNYITNYSELIGR